MSSNRLLVITNRYPAHPDDAASPFVADFVRGLRRHDLDCTVLTPHHRAGRYDDDDSIVRFQWGEDAHTIGSLPLARPSTWGKIRRYFHAGYREAQRLHREKNFDFCLALWAAPSGLIARRLRTKYRLPYAVWCLGSDIHTYARLPFVGNLIIETLQSSDRVFSDGHALGRAAEQLSGCPYHFLPSLRKVPMMPGAGDEKCEPLIICPGRVEKAKGVFDLLDAFRLIAPTFASWNLNYVGDGGARMQLERRIAEFGLSDRVQSLGFVPANEMFQMMSRSSVVVIPTRCDSLPLTFGEAMQLRRPVIVTDVGDLGHFTRKYQVGMVVPPAAPSALADALTRFITEENDCSGRFEPCLRVLDVDAAADRFADWLHNHLAHPSEVREAVLC
jgi:glycosyltransferase involved in cell wall biosynthesis